MNDLTHRGRRIAWIPCLSLVLSILVIKACVIGYGVHCAYDHPLSTHDYIRNYHHHRLIHRYLDPRDIRFFELWVASDAQWYLAIAATGYPERAEFDTDAATVRPKLICETDTQLKYAFFPLWPLVIRACTWLISDSYIAAFVAANTISLLALVLLFRLLAACIGDRQAFWTVLFFACSPFAMFLHVPFTESLFLLLSVWTFRETERRNWWLAGLCIGLAMITRPNGCALLLVPVAYWISLAIREGGSSRVNLRGVAWLSVGAIPLGAFLVHNYVKTGDPLYFMQATTWWGYDDGVSLRHLWHNTYGNAMRFLHLPLHGFHHSKIDVLVLVAATGAIVAGIRRLPLHYTAYSVAVILVPLLTKDLMSFSRYALMAWPLFCVPSVYLKGADCRWVFGIALPLLLAAQCACMGGFVNWHWVG